jgi:hypothetical protein
MREPDEDKRQDQNQRAAAAAAGALLGGTIAGPVGAAVGAGLGPMLEPLVRGVWAELSASTRRRQTEVLFWAIRNGVPIDEMEDRINESERSQLLTGVALDAARRTAWEDKVRTLGRSLASGLLVTDDATVDTEQMIIAAIADIEGPQLAMLEFLVRWYPTPMAAGDLIIGPIDLPEDTHKGGGWNVYWREWPYPLIAYARPNLLSIAPSLLATLQRHGLIIQNAYTDEGMDRIQNELFFDELEHSSGSQIRPDQRSGIYRFEGQPKVPWQTGRAPLPRWSPTELGEQVFLRFRDAGTELPDVWTAGPADQQQ